MIQPGNPYKRVQDWLFRLESPVPDVWPKIRSRIESKTQTDSQPVDEHIKSNPAKSMFQNIQAEKFGRRRRSLVSAVSLLLVLSIAVVSLFVLSGSASIRAIERPAYPQEVDFQSPENNRRFSDYSVDPLYQKAYIDFAIRSAQKIVGSNASQNRLYSPLSLWFALALSADSASNNTRQEILQALSLSQFKSEWIGQQSSSLYRRLCFENDVGRLKVLNSLWLDKLIPFNQDFMKKAAETYFAESNQIDFKNASANRAIIDWVNGQTGDQLKDRLLRFFRTLGGNGMESGQLGSMQSVMTLVNAVSFADQWTERFDETLTTPGLFYLPEGRTVIPQFLRRKYSSHAFMAVEGYTAAGIPFKNGSSMIFVLPDKTETPHSILANSEWMQQIIGLKNQQNGEVIFEIPKFDIKSEARNISKSLEAMGIYDAFNPLQADFSVLSNAKPIWLSRIEQSTRVKIDERGCTADTVTGVRLSAASILRGKCEMILNRPFLFIILGPDGYPLFIGVVENPTV